MSLWRRDRDDARLGAAGLDEAESVVEVTRFEYIPVGDDALARITALGRGEAPDPGHVSLIVRNGHGDRRLEALPDSRVDTGGRLRIAFAAPLEVLRKPDATFALQVGDAVLDLPQPAFQSSRRRFERAAADATVEIKRDLEEAERDRDAARDVASLLRAETSQMRERIATLEAERDDAEARASASGAATAEARARADAVNAEVGRVRTELEAAVRERDALQARVDQLAAELDEERERAEADVPRLQRELAEQRDARAAAARELDAERDRAEALSSELEDVRMRVAALDVSLREHDQIDGEVVAVDDALPDAESVALARVPASVSIDGAELREVLEARNRLAAAQLEFDSARAALRSSLFAHEGDPGGAQEAVEREQWAREELEDAQAAWDRAWGTAEAALTVRESGAEEIQGTS